MTTGVFFVSVQATYKTLELAIFRDEQCLHRVLSQEQRASSFLAPMLNELLAQAGLTLSDISFIAVDTGPGAFTSLRVVIATINGIAFASKIPLIGVTSFEGFFQQIDAPRVLALLNAFNNDVYVAYTCNGIIKHSGWVKYHALGALLADEATSEQVMLVGNGIDAYPDCLESVLSVFPGGSVLELAVPSVKAIGVCGYQKWLQGDRSTRLTPAYLKTLVFAVQGTKD